MAREGEATQDINIAYLKNLSALSSKHDLKSNW